MTACAHIFRSGLLRCLALLVLLSVTACARGPLYTPGKSPADVPAQIDTINLKEVIQVDSFDATKGEYVRNFDPTPELHEFVALAKANVVSQLTNFGYKVVENQPADIDLGVAVFFHRDILFGGRMIAIACRVYEPNGGQIFHAGKGHITDVGLRDMLYGPESKDLIAAVSREAVIIMVNEIRKGTKPSVTPSQVATPQAPAAPARSADQNAGAPTS